MKIKPDKYLKKLVCLYVEDDESIREPFSMILQRYFKELLVAKNGEEGVAQYLSQKPDIILSDIRMPVMDGIEMASIIKDNDPDAIVIFITAFSDVDNLKEAIDLGVDGYITKPVDKYKLLRKLNKLAGFIKHKKEADEFTILLKEILDKQLQPIIVLEQEEIKLKNKAFEEIFGKYGSFAKLQEHLPIQLDIEGIQKIEYCYNNEELTFEVTVQKINENFTLITLTDVTEYEEEILTDQLTKVYNRKVLNALLPKLYGKKVYVTILDIDDFKKVNDTFGHLIGDEVLKAVANILKSSLRKEDKIIRWGGEEFVIILDNINDDTIAFKRAEILRQKIADLEIEEVGHITCSFGVCGHYIEHAKDFDLLLEGADDALYKAKKSGKNNVQECHLDQKRGG